jgi:ZIP family zinc transporter
VLYALVIATLTGLTTGLGVVPLLVRPTLPRRLFDAILGMGAGLMLSAATLGLLAAALGRVRPGGQLDVGALLEVVLGFATGVVVLIALERLPHEHAGGHPEHGAHARQGLLISGAMVIHRLPEGFAIGAGFAGGATRSLGWVLAIAVAFQNACEGAVMGAPLLAAGWSRARALAAVTATGLATPVAALAGYALGASAGLPFFLALAAGGLIYLISNEIIPETHSHGNEGLATLGLVCGFVITVTVIALGGD